MAIIRSSFKTSYFQFRGENNCTLLGLAICKNFKSYLLKFVEEAKNLINPSTIIIFLRYFPLILKGKIE